MTDEEFNALTTNEKVYHLHEVEHWTTNQIARKLDLTIQHVHRIHNNNYPINKRKKYVKSHGREMRKDDVAWFWSQVAQSVLAQQSTIVAASNR
jgi:hypothetical protein